MYEKKCEKQNKESTYNTESMEFDSKNLHPQPKVCDDYNFIFKLYGLE